MTNPTFSPGDRVRVVRNGSPQSTRLAGETGTCVRQDQAGSAAIDSPRFRAKYPVAVILDGRMYAQAWSLDELELLP